jgi:hypothetical protein
MIGDDRVEVEAKNKRRRIEESRDEKSPGTSDWVAAIAVLNKLLNNNSDLVGFDTTA